MKAKETIARIESIIYTGFEWICRVILVFITLLIAVQVFLREAFQYSIPWSEEVSLMGFIYITFFSMAIAVRHDQHLRVELFVSKFPRAGKKAIDLIDNIVMLAISIMMFYTGIKLVQYGMSSIMPSTRWPTAVIYLPTPICGIMASVQQLLRIVGLSESEASKNFIGEVEAK